VGLWHGARCVHHDRMRGPDGLNAQDPGVRLLAKVARERWPDRMATGGGVLLAHCGEVEGVGVGATRWILDVREREGAVHRCVDTVRDVATMVTEGGPFGLALAWPRAHLGMDFSQWSLAAAALGLAPHGWLLCSARKQKGGKRLAAFVESIFGRVEVLARGGGYQVYGASRGDGFNVEAAHEACAARYQWPLPDTSLPKMISGPGVFSRRALDDGTRVLLTHLQTHAERFADCTHVVDLCAGVGPLALGAAHQFPGAQVLAVDSNLLAVHDMRENIVRHQLEDRVQARLYDGMPPVGAPESAGFEGKVGLVLMNPPTHAPREALASLVAPLRDYLREGGVVCAVVNRPGTMRAVFQGMGASGDAYDYPGFTVLEIRWTR